MDRKVVLYISMSLDGYIADRNDDLSFLSIVEKDGEDYGYADFVKSVDTVIVGRKSYEKVLSMGYDYPHTDKDVYIMTRTKRPAIGTFKFHSGSLKDLIKEIKTKQGGNIYCDGGAEIVTELLNDNLIDELIISLIPILMGGGVRLFNDGRPEQKLEFVSTKSYDTGLIQLHYSYANN